ncbi:hypothetical protein M407DRAFT_25301 [Tulasnella calospora MUT 4182]|uniref:Uncharacterized protein n=1 Tax=Tulasnella calospora MUT 4182 TaxID=1051891 RepID=A0A0C3KVD8_9AGAM|nr:hypothetical protein M407DRAFT_25301 [Tulasnella calospora MUT 4182]
MNSLDRRTLKEAIDVLVGAGEQSGPDVEVEESSSSPHSLIIALEEQASALLLALRAIHNEEQGCSQEGSAESVRVRRAIRLISNSVIRPNSAEQLCDLDIPNTASSDAFAISILKIEAEVCQALRHQRRNALLPVAHLPSEVMIQILRGVLEGGWQDVPMMLRSLILVSREWRALVEETPSLWCHIELERSHARPSYLTTALKRSQNLLLTINYHYQFTRTIAPDFFLEEICKHMQRWRSVELSLDGRPEDFSLLNGAFPEHLQRFQINIHINLGLPLSLFNNRRPPILKYIRLGGCTVDWDSGLFKDLGSLDLGSSYPDEGPSIAQLLGALQQCPELEQLRFHFVDFCRGSPFQHTPPSVVHLPKLQSLYLWADYAHIFEILATVKMPTCRILDLRTSIPRGQWPIFASEPLQPHGSVISSISKAATNVDLEWRNGLMAVSTKSGATEFRGMRLSFGGISEHQSQVLDWLAETIGLEEVGVPTNLKLGLSVWTDEMANMLIRIKSTTSMEITDNPFLQRGLLAWLGTPLRGAGLDTDGSFPLPQLVVLEGLSSSVGRGILNMVQSRHGHGRLELMTAVELPSPLKRIKLRSAGQLRLDRGYFRQLEKAMRGGEVLED